MAKWREVKLGEIAYVNMGQSPKSVFFNQTGEGMKFLQGNRTFGRMFPSYDTYTTDITKTADDGDILFTVRAPVGNINLASTKVCIGRGIASIRSKQNQMFLFYYLKSNVDLIRSAENGTTYSSVNRKDLEQFKLYIPDLPTQEKIANILFTYDRLIENNNRRIKLLEKSAEELYKEWFVRMRFPGHENTKFVNGIPEGWEVKRIGEICEVGSSKRVYLSDYVDEGVPFYRSKEIITLSEESQISEPLFISRRAYDKFKNKFGSPLKYDILITSVGTIGVSYMSDGHEFYFKDGNLTWLKTSQKLDIAFYVLSWLKNEVGLNAIKSSLIGTSQSALTIQSLKKIKITIPSKEILNDFSEKVKQIYEMGNNLKRKNQNLIKQRDLLLPRLMSGKMEV